MLSRMTASEQITQEATSWPGVTAGTGRRGEWAFTIGRREIGHLHGDRVAHFGFARDVGTALRADGRVGPHPVNPHSPKLAARRIDDARNVAEVIALMRLNYDRELAVPLAA